MMMDSVIPFEKSKNRVRTNEWMNEWLTEWVNELMCVRAQVWEHTVPIYTHHRISHGKMVKIFCSNSDSGNVKTLTCNMVYRTSCKSMKMFSVDSQATTTTTITTTNMANVQCVLCTQKQKPTKQDIYSNIDYTQYCMYRHTPTKMFVFTLDLKFGFIGMMRYAKTAEKWSILCLPRRGRKIDENSFDGYF